MLFNKMVFTNALYNINSIFRNYNNVSSIPRGVFYNNYIFNHKCLKENTHSIRVWSGKTFFDWCYDDMGSDNFISAIDYSINDDFVKIEYMNLNDENSGLGHKTKYLLSKNDVNELNASMFEYIKNVAKENKKNKIIVDVHNNLRIFNIYYKDYGFVATNRRCVDNPFWIEAEMQL